MFAFLKSIYLRIKYRKKIKSLKKRTRYIYK